MEHMARLASVEQSIGASDKFAKVLHELFDHNKYILENPHDYDKRSIKSEILKLYINDSKEFKDYLIYVGFKMINCEFAYPREETLSRLRIAQAAIERKMEFCYDPSLYRNKNYDTSGFKENKPKLLPVRIVRSRNPLLLKIQELFNHMIKFEDEELHRLARKEIPIVSLQLMAMDRVRNQQQEIKSGETKAPDLPYDIALLMELVIWFKYKFFEWVDKPSCEKCDSTTTYVESTKMTFDREYCNVEVYRCTSCSRIVYFPRLNSPRAVLNRRRGRCGEWATCFTLMCRSLGFDTRYVYDITDHVWCEVFDFDSGAWLHVDPCEAAIDSPLVYTHGWGKKLSYVIAFSKDDLQDVTWRYCSNHKEVMKRRRFCREHDLIQVIMDLRYQRQLQVSEPRRRYLQKRCVEELVQLMVQRKPHESETRGRISGAEKWREDRGEVGVGANYSFLFKYPGDFSIQYFPVSDVYTVQCEVGIYEISSWAAGTYTTENIFRKEEPDWKMVYLARSEKSDVGRVSWHVTAEEGMIMTNVTMRATVDTREGGRIIWRVVGCDEPLRVKSSVIHAIDGTFKTLEVSAELSGGSGNEAWQHAQLFRTSMKSLLPAFILCATLEPDPDYVEPQ